MSEPGLSEDMALRIGLAARVLPDTEPRRLMNVLIEVLGLPLTEDRMDTLSERGFREAGDGAFSDVSLPVLKQAMDLLRGKGLETEEAIPEPESGAGEELPGSVRIGVGSNSGENVDGHFGTCLRFLIYQVTPEVIRLVDVRRPEKGEGGVDKNVPRAELVADCDLLYVMSIGGPAAAQVVKQEVHPVKVPEGGAARAVLQRTRETLASNPPPWLAKAMGRTTG